MGIGVLIVEDEFLLRADAVEFMEHSGFTVYEASNADEAIDWSSVKYPDSPDF